MPQFSITNQDYLRIREQPMAGSTFVNWLKVLRDNHFSIDWQFVPRALYVTGMISALTPFRLYEQRRYQKDIENTTVKAPLFIIGHWRSGTTFLHYLLGQDKRLGYVSTFETMTPSMIIANEELFRNMVKNHLPSKRPMDDLEMHATLPYEEEYAIANTSPFSFYLAWYFPRNWKHYFDSYVLCKNQQSIDSWKHSYELFLKKIAYKNNGKRIMLKSLVNTARIKHLLELFPDAKFIHIHRNPYKVYLSTWKLYQKILPIFSFQHISTEALEDNIIYSYKELFSHYLSQRYLIPKDNLIEIAYEDFIEHPIERLKEIYCSLDLEGFDAAQPAFERYVKEHENYKADSYTFDKQIKQKVYTEWKQTFDAFGYKK